MVIVKERCSCKAILAGKKMKGWYTEGEDEDEGELVKDRRGPER